MANATELFRQGKTREIWQKYCGFIDLSIDEFMKIQERLLMEQIDLLSKCELGRKIMGNKIPKSVGEFRENVPLTTYEDYAPYLSEKREDVLCTKPLYWACTSGRSGVYRFKWVPISREMFQEWANTVFAMLIFATCQRRNDFIFEENDRFLYCMAPLPYGTGMIPYGLSEVFPFKYLPSVEEAEKMSFQERIKIGFDLAFKDRIDIFFGISSILMRIGERFSREAGKVEFSPILLHPKALFRIIRGLIICKLAKRPMCPKDLWNVKGMATGGMDTTIFKDKIEYYWGKPPLEIYAAVDGGMIATQTWDYKDMTFVPQINFLEFIPEKEYLEGERDSSYHPSTVLLNEVKEGEKYEIVITTLKGGIFMRYRIGDMVKITSLVNEKLGINIPQMVFWTRTGNIIDLAGFTRLTEKTIWQSIENSGVNYIEWTVRKEIMKGQPILRFYIELKSSEQKSREEVEEAIHQSLKDIDSDYRDIEEMLGFKPLTVTLLSSGAFQRYTEGKLRAGADLAQLKPLHINPSEDVMKELLSDGKLDLDA